MPRRSAALASRRQAGSSAACRPEVYDAHCGRPLIWALGGGLDRGWGRRLVYRVGASRVLPLFRLICVLARSVCSPRRRRLASLAQCRRCRRRVPPRAVAERSVAGAGGSRRRPRRERAHRAERAAAPRGRTQLVRRSFCRRLSSPPPVPEVAVVVACPSSVAAGRGSVLGLVDVGVGGDGRRRVELSDPTLAPRGTFGSHLQAPRRRPRCSSELVV